MRILARTYDSIWDRSRIARVIEWRLTKLFLSEWFPKGGIVIGGCGRSGTTLLQGILSAHSRICAIPHETQALYPRIRPFLILKELYVARRKKPESRWWCEKTPMNIRNVHRIISFMGPRGKFIHIVRDGRDVVTSMHPKRPNTYWVSIDRWIADVSAGLIAEESNQVERVRYEDIVRYPRTTMHKLMQSIEEDLEGNLFCWQKCGSVQDHSSWTEGPKAIHSQSLGKWRRPEHDKRVHEFMLRGEAKRLLVELNYL